MRAQILELQAKVEQKEHGQDFLFREIERLRNDRDAWKAKARDLEVSRNRWKLRAEAAEWGNTQLMRKRMKTRRTQAQPLRAEG